MSADCDGEHIRSVSNFNYAPNLARSAPAREVDTTPIQFPGCAGRDRIEQIDRGLSGTGRDRLRATGQLPRSGVAVAGYVLACRALDHGAPGYCQPCSSKRPASPRRGTFQCWPTSESPTRKVAFRSMCSCCSRNCSSPINSRAASRTIPSEGLSLAPQMFPRLQSSDSIGPKNSKRTRSAATLRSRSMRLMCTMNGLGPRK